MNQLHKSDEFVRNLIEKLSQRDEKTIVVAFGDHLPTMGLTDEDMKSGSIYKTQYFTWNNFDLQKQDADLYAYQLLAHYTDQVGIHEGTIFRYHQTQMDSITYQDGLEMLQYDLLYGERFTYEVSNPYPASDIIMGIDDVVIDKYSTSFDGSMLFIHGSGFTNWSRVYVNGEKVSTTYMSSGVLRISPDAVADQDVITVCQLGSSNTIFRTSNEITYEAPETTESTEDTETSESSEKDE